jgi:hypothetical protein
MACGSGVKVNSGNGGKEGVKYAFSCLANELPRSKLTGYQNIAVRFYPNGVAPERFNPGPRFGLAWIPDRNIRE